MSLISVVINADTRPGCSNAVSKIGDLGEAEPLKGCRSLDFATDGVVNKRNFFKGHEVEVLLFVDKHEDLTAGMWLQLGNMHREGVIQKLDVRQHDRTRHRWNDWIYHLSCREASGDYIVHFDGDFAVFRDPAYDAVGQFTKWLDEGYSYVCQPTALASHGMTHASTRFFMAKRETLDFPRIENYLLHFSRFQMEFKAHAPCYEHLLGIMAGEGKVLYPPFNPDQWIGVSWVHYHRGTLGKLNAMTWEEQRAYVMETCGGPCGPMDLIGQPLL